MQAMKSARAQVVGASESVLSMPKAELHAHVEGTVSPELARRLARRHGLTLPSHLFDRCGGYRWVDFETFVTQTYATVAATVRTAEDYHDVVYDYLSRLAAENAVYTELSIAPVSTERLTGLPAREALAGMHTAIDAARLDFGIEARLLVTLIRHLDPALGEQEVRYFVDNPHPYVTGVNIAGDEQPGDIFAHKAAFALAHRAGLHATAHAGEARGPQAIWDLLEAVPFVRRIGHGVRAVEDPELLAELAARGIVLEVCPSSNICLGIYKDYAEHPLKALADAGVEVTINSDDPPFFGTSLGREYRLAREKLGLSTEALWQCTTDAIAAAFVDEETRARLLARLHRPGTSSEQGGAMRMVSSDDSRRAALRGCAIFSGLSDTTLDGVVSASEQVRFAPGEVLVRRGAVSREVLVVLDGLAAVTADAPWERGRVALSWVKPSESIGEVGVLSGQRRTVTVTAASEVVALRFSEAAFLEQLSMQPVVRLHIMRTLSRRLAAETRRRITAKRSARLIAVLHADGEDAAPLAEALLRGADGSAARLSGLDEGHPASGLGRTVSATGALERLMADADLGVVDLNVSAGAELLRPLLERVDIVMVSPQAAAQRSQAELLALAGERKLTIQPTTLAPGDAAQALARLGRPHEVTVFIPSTADVDQPIDPAPYVERATALLGECFGGATVRDATGVWKSEALGLVSEPIVTVSSSCSRSQLDRHLDAVTAFLFGLKETMRQEAMALTLDGRLILL